MVIKTRRPWIKAALIGALSITAILAAQGLINGIMDSSRGPASAADLHIPLLDKASRFAGGSGMVLRGGRTVYTWGDVNKLYDLKSTTKSIGVTALGLALKDGLIQLDDRVADRFPMLGMIPKQNQETGWIHQITYLDLATHTAGFDKHGGYEPLLFKPGTAWAYSDGGANWLADALTTLYQRDLQDLLFERVFDKLGIDRKDLRWRENAYREPRLNDIPRREFGSGIHANVKAMAGIGLLYLRRGQWNGETILTREFVDLARKPLDRISVLPVKNDLKHRFDGAAGQMGLLWWNNGDGNMKGVPKDTFFSWGLHDSFIVVIPSLDMVIARAGETIAENQKSNDDSVLERLLRPIVASVNFGSPVPGSPCISNLGWDDPATIIRKADGSDNWPITWGSDDRLYTAYGDGKGFESQTQKKLSLGLAILEGIPPAIEGSNLRSTIEQYGDGPEGKKASGMLMVDNILYMWVRNVTDSKTGSRLAWSDDFGRNWQWSPWVFGQFGGCTFINYGPNYHGARDNYVYTVTHDNKSAYERSDRFILMRVPANAILNREAYAFFKGFDENENPLWTKNIKERAAVFTDPGRCHRSGISYNKFIGRYIWWQGKFAKGVNGARESKSFGIFDAPEPWGPWTTVYHTDCWDVATGESGSFPTKWISDGGRTMYLVFSGEDSFSVRKASLTLNPG